jgi:GH35 family endo-1,4-beta-xylanase
MSFAEIPCGSKVGQQEQPREMANPCFGGGSRFLGAGQWRPRAIVVRAQLSETDYASTLAREFNMLEPEDALKWEVVHPARSRSIFRKPTGLWISRPTRYEGSRGHTLVWHQQNPKWLTEGNSLRAN